MISQNPHLPETKFNLSEDEVPLIRDAIACIKSRRPVNDDAARSVMKLTKGKNYDFTLLETANVLEKLLKEQGFEVAETNSTISGWSF